MLNNIAWDLDLLGDYQQARLFCRQSLALTTEFSLLDVEAAAWGTLGYAEHHLGNLAEAAACYQRALSISRKLADRRNEASALTHLGDACQASGERERAREAWQQALEILNELQQPDASKVRAKLADTDSQVLLDG